MNSLFKIAILSLGLMLSCGSPFAVADSGATADQMQGALNQGKVLGHYLGSSNPMQRANGTSTSFTASPQGGAPDMGASGYASNADYKVTFNCKTKDPIYIAGNTLEIGDCTLSGTGANAKVQAINLAICTKSTSGGACGPTDFSPYTTVYAGQATILTPSTIGALISTCAADGSLTCSGDLVLRATLSVSGAQLASQGSAAAQGMAAQQMITSTYNNGAYQAEIQSAGPGLNTCYQGQVQSGLESDGVVHTCDGQQSATFAANQCPAPVEQCVQYATQTNNWTSTCNSDVPIDAQTCTAVTPTQDCAVTIPTQNYSCNKVLTVSVTGSSSPPTCTVGARLLTYTYYGIKTYVNCASSTSYYVYLNDGLYNSNSITSAYMPATATSFPMKFSGAGTYYNYSYTQVYLAQTCTATTCTLSEKIVYDLGGTMYYGYSSASFPITGGTTYTAVDTWDDQCTTYESAQ